MKRFLLTILLMVPLLVFCQPSSQSISDLYNMSFGRYGCLNISDTSAHIGKWGAFQTDTITVISQAIILNYHSETGTWYNDTITNWYLPAGTIKSWAIRKIDLTSGKGSLYYEKP